MAREPGPKTGRLSGVKARHSRKNNLFSYFMPTFQNWTLTHLKSSYSELKSLFVKGVSVLMYWTMKCELDLSVQRPHASYRCGIGPVVCLIEDGQ